MTKRKSKGKTGTAPKKDRAWFDRKLAELRAELEKLPAERREQFMRELQKPGEQ